ncbi:nucleoside triphosphate pyrophosphohydrolase [Thalassotalea sp. LPB0316]|nr:nucleoside triphosphate pyrophosphohydrolase [Thalassotalea sp. LPB0316]
MLEAPASIDKLRWIMAQLRDPETGCPWDIKQTFATIVPHTIEEAYEVADAIALEDFVELEKELGDLLFQVIFYSQLGEEQQVLSFDGVIEKVCEKLIRRHPHVFSDTDLATDEQIKANWENEKAKEREQKNQTSSLSILADIPKSLPALSQANKIQKRCAHVGFDWSSIEDVFAKVEEEVAEVKAELPTGGEALNQELGDLLFAVVNLCRHAKQDPESLLRAANQKFTKRFEQVERLAREQHSQVENCDLAQLEAYWQQVKAEEKTR